MYITIFALINLFILDVPSCPVGPLVIDNVTHESADLKWKPPESDAGSQLLGYIVESRLASRTFWSKAGTVDSKTTTFKATNLIEDTEYYFQVIAYNAEGNSKPLEASDVTKPTRKLGEFCICLILLY